MKKRDFILIGTILIVVLLSFVVFLFNKKANYAHIYLNDTLVMSVSLDKDDEFFVNGNISKVKIKVKDGKIGIIENDCPDHTCINMGFINSSSRTIICVPNGITIKVDNHDGVDISI